MLINNLEGNMPTLLHVRSKNIVANVTKHKNRTEDLVMNLKKNKTKILLHIRRAYALLLNYLLAYDFIFFVIGWASRIVFRKTIKSAFLLYPSQRRYSEAYSYKWYHNLSQWTPRLIGFLWQNGSLSLTFAISACDKDIWTDDGTNLKKVYNRIEHIRKKLGADQISFAGILPGVLMSKGIMSHSVERDVTVPAVIKAIDLVKKKEKMPSHTVIIVLGSNGFIGRLVIKTLRARSNCAVFSLDLVNGYEFDRMAVGPAIVLNVTKRGGLKEYIPSMHSGMVVLNEVYPPPKRGVVKKIKDTGAKIYHINGLKGRAFPSFPHDYAGGIPCCAGHLPENSEEMEVVISEL